jgi:hypothetical protein
MSDFEIASFYHPKNITSGFGRIVFAKATTTLAGHYMPEGWVLPGGQRTSDEARAKRCADSIDEVVRRSSRRTDLVPA